MASGAAVARLVVVAGIATALLAGIAERGSEGSASAAGGPDAVAGATAPARAFQEGTDAARDSAGFRSARTYPAVALPVRLRIPAAGVDSTLQHLRRAADGTITTPSRWELAGWYAQGPRPGQAGPAVLLGHVDSRSGPAVFFHLEDLRPGDLVHVDRADGSTVDFRVTGSAQVAKSRFPSDLVYSPTLEPSLRLVTCGGTFDAATGHYRDNIIVFALPA
jgi:hypothetical protein